MLRRLGFPAIGQHRRFVTAICVDALGSGVFMPVEILFFLATTDLSLVDVGLAISLAALLSLPVGPYVGTLVDRYGAKPVLLTSNLVQALGFFALLDTHSLPMLVLWTLVISSGRTAFWGSYSNIIAAIALPGEREKWFGFLGALRNIGFAVGGLVAGTAAGIGTLTAYRVVVVANGASYVLAFVLLLAVPAASQAAHQALPGSWREVLADGRYRWLLANQVCYCLMMIALNFAMPVYVVKVINLPGWVVGAVFTINTLLVGFGQGLAVRGMTGRVRWRVLALSQAAFAASYVVLLGADHSPEVVAIVAMLAGVCVYTMGELLGGPVLSALSVEAASAHLLGRYQSLIQLCWNASAVIAPVGYAWLLQWGAAPMWGTLLGLGVVGMLLALRLGRVLPRAAEVVTNQAEADPVATPGHPVDPALDVPTSS